MLQARASVDPGDVVGPVHRRLFGSFVEHMGRAVYGGIYEPGHPTADEDGFRRDVLDLVRELGVTVVRYPGGNFVSGYRWEDGVGPRERRPPRLNLAWHLTETNEFGLDEFVRWCRKAGVEPMIALNLGTLGVGEALDELEYANHRRGTALSDWRIANGSPEPHGIRMWCLGNEMDGPWQLGHKTAGEYGRVAAETARAMRQIDPGLELVACGSSGPGMPTFGDWEAAVLAETHELVDFVSLHSYYEETGGDLASFLASGCEMDSFIGRVVSIADSVAEKVGSARRLALSFDEWNVWYLSRHMAQPPMTDWPQTARQGEDAYTAADAVVVGSLLITLLRHADRVSSACLAQLVNVIAPIHTEPGGDAWRTPTFYPFSITSRSAKGRVLRTSVTSPAVATARYGDVPAVDAAVTSDEASASVAVFAVNRHPAEEAELTVELGDSRGRRVEECLLVHEDDPHGASTLDDRERVVPHTGHAVIAGDRLTLSLPPVSWCAVRLTLPG